MTSPSENHNLAIIPYEYPDSPFILPDIMLIDSFGVTHLAYTLMVDASIQGEKYSQRLNSHYDDTPLVKMIPKKLHCRLHRVSGKYPPFAPSVAIPAKVTRAVYHGIKSKFIPHENPIDILDDIVETKKDKKRKRSASTGSFKKQDTASTLIKKSSHTVDSVDDMVITAEIVRRGLWHFRKERWNALFLQGNRRRKMGKKETREFYINVVGSVSSITSKALLTTKNEEIAALRASHSNAMDQLHINYGLEHAGLVEENAKLKEELSKAQPTLETERSSNSAHLKSFVAMFAKVLRPHLFVCHLLCRYASPCCVMCFEILLKL
ncbi:hypothetical protein R3W88_008677 [Solanum pinnatisectum]|uniref:Uncharacterized protein n=1 Tax=Solanum pinnatisectum TaxID=50273 RepID=A0AAV9M9A7_9SOLN|nr:hypothetical protein R3W88_008677 [Solanum pinnatisectum]